MGITEIRNPGQARDEDLKWRLPLDEKEKRIQDDITMRHMVMGTYVPMVPIPADGRLVDHTTTGNTGDMHASSWTGCYLVAAAFRYAWASKQGTREELESAQALVETLVHGIEVLTHVSGIPGLLARKVVYGHGPAVEERVDNNSRNEWHQGAGKYSNLRFRGHPSHHNYHHVIRGLSILYYVLSMERDPPTEVRELLDRVRIIVSEMMEFGYKANDLTLMTVDGRESARLIYGATKGQPSTTGLMATNCLKFTHWITGDVWYGAKYREWVDWFGYRDVGHWPPDRWQAYYGRTHTPDHDDTEHTLASLWLVCRIEEDDVLRKFYKMAAKSIFDSKRRDKRAPFNYFYASITGDVEGADLQGALETLQMYPSVTLTYPLMNSIRPDIEVVERRRGRGSVLLPFKDQPLDNAYDWKGDPYVLDRWLSREINAMAVSDEDPEVWYLCDSAGTLYQSLNGGESFGVSDFRHGARVRDVAFAGGKSRIALLATDCGVFRTDTGGYRNSWHRVRVGTAGAPARKIVCDPLNPNVVWAVTDEGVYRSVDLGMEEAGKAWESVSGPMPSGIKSVPGQKNRVVYGLAPGKRPVIYAALGGRLFRKDLAEEGWEMSPVNVEDYHMIPNFRCITPSPFDPDRLVMLLDLNVWGRDMPLTLSSEDGGRNVSVIGWDLPSSGHPSRGSGLEGTSLSSVRFNRDGPTVLYGSSSRGFHRSRDGGTSWDLCNEGLRIPYLYRVFVPRQVPGKIFASTPAGLHSSTDGGGTWDPPMLVLNGPGVDRSERGGLGYLCAYWPGRYFGYLTDGETRAPPESWGK